MEEKTSSLKNQISETKLENKEEKKTEQIKEGKNKEENTNLLLSK